MDELRFDGQVAVITGAGRGLGREYALLLASRGARVVVNDFGVGISDVDDSVAAPPVNPADEVVAEITGLGGEAVANHDTVATTEGGAAIVQTALDTWGTVDICVNNAGQVRMQPFAEFPDEHIATVISTQLLGTLNVGRAAWRVMQRNGGGRIINVSSGAGYGGFTNSTVYSMAKAGVIGFTKALAAELAAKGVTVNAIAPGYVATKMVMAIKPEVLETIVASVPMKRLAKPEEIGFACAYLCDELSGFTTGATININGGLYYQ